MDQLNKLQLTLFRKANAGNFFQQLAGFSNRAVQPF